MLGDKLLIIDDDKVWRYCIAKYFSEVLNYTTYTAASAAEGVKLVEKIRPDFVLTDYHLVDGDARRICQYIRASDKLKRTFVTVISGDTMCRETAYEECQADNFIPKDTKYSVIHSLLQGQRRRSCLDRGIVQAGDIALQGNTRQVYQNTTLVAELCKEHFEFFSLLIRRSPEYVAESEIFEKALNFDYSPEKHAAFSMMASRLRQKLGPIGERIQNKKDAGWRYVQPDPKTNPEK